MPSDQSTWIITAPQDGDSEGLLQELTSKLSQQSKTFSPSSVGQLYIPSFKVYCCAPPSFFSSRDSRRGRSTYLSHSLNNYRNTIITSQPPSPRSSKRSATF